MNLFDKVIVFKEEFQYIAQLAPAERLEYIMEIYEATQTSEIKFSKEQFEQMFDIDEPEVQLPPDIDPDKLERVDVVVDNKTIMIESNKLRALRLIRNRFMEDGYIIQRDKQLEKDLKSDKVTKYLRVFSIIGHADPICYN